MTSSDARDERRAAFGHILWAYAAALAVALVTGWYVDRSPFWDAAAADLAATVVIFAFSLRYRNASFYDAYWSVAPPVIALYWLALGGGDPARGALVLVGVCAWAARLTHNWARGWDGLHHEDWRYGMLRERTGRAYPLVNLFGIHLFPTVQVFLGCMALYPALTLGGEAGLLDAAAALVVGLAVLLQWVSDNQLRRFVLTNDDPQRVLDTGLWAWSRHPNYLGEILFWWGLWLFGLASDPTWWWTVVGPLCITVMFLFMSIPMIERRHLERRPDYADYARRTPTLLPLIPG
jgi:steroid 5-alpha reductase family enzyme